MHEAAIAEGILRVALGALPRPEARITQINVVAGVLTGVEDESLRMWFNQISQATPAQGATIVVNHLPGKVVCLECKHAFLYDGSGPVTVDCPKCAGVVTLEGGSEMYVDSVEVENEN
jgi:hydrogenase nickel incorporation protein HypA/HybF